MTESKARTLEEIGDFWDSHSLAEHWNQNPKTMTHKESRSHEEEWNGVQNNHGKHCLCDLVALCENFGVRFGYSCPPNAMKL
jgi:hypothetical protein